MKPRILRLGAALAAGVATLLVASAVPASANTSDVTSLTATSTLNSDGTVTVRLSGTWRWPAGQKCTGRYGTGFAVNWWGVGSSSTPANNFTLTNATKITSTDQGFNGNSPSVGSINSTGSLVFPSGGPYAGQRFYVSTYYDASEIFTQDFCNRAQPPNGTSTDPFGDSFFVQATYPSSANVPALVCVNSYDEHGTVGNPPTGSGGALPDAFNPAKEKDNSITQKQFQIASNCASTAPVDALPTGAVGGLGLAGLTAMGLIAFFIRSRRHA